MARPPLPGSILIVDDERILGDALRRTLALDGHETCYYPDPEDALRALRARPFDVLLTDLVMPAIDGLELMCRAKRIRPSCEVVVMTAFATVDTAREALKRGAVDYLTKPFSVERDLLPLIRTLLATPGGCEAEAAAAEPRTPVPGIVAASPPMRALLEKLPRIARSRAGVLLRGDSGTGKEVIATALHALSERWARPLVKVNCAALPESLLEAELFGAAKGAYTGAHSDRPGLFQAAHGGTLLLDEVGELPASIQAKLLRVLQDGEFARVGELGRPLRVDVRIVAATNRDLEAAVAAGAFRKDLYYRLNVVPILLPPLRERREDLAPLTRSFLESLAPGRAVRMHPEAWSLLERYDWPGNVRELRNALEHALVLGDGEEIRPADLPASLQLAPAQAAGGDDDDTLQDIERRCLAQALVKTGFNRTRAARLLGITRRTLGYRLRKYELEDEIQILRLSRSGPREPLRAAPALPLREVV
jgi:two-component system response regulator HydG